MDNIREFLTRKIGPLPAWAWGVLIAAGIWLMRSLRGTVDSPRASSPSGGGGTAVVPSLSGMGAPPPMTGTGDPVAEQSSLFVSTSGFTAEGDPSSVSGILDALLAAQRSSTSTGGGATGTTQSDPVAAPVNQTQTSTTTTTKRYRLYWLSNPGGTVGTYPTRLECSLAAQRLDPSSNPPGSSMGCAVA